MNNHTPPAGQATRLFTLLALITLLAAAPAHTVEPGGAPQDLSAAGWRAIQSDVAKLTAGDGANFDRFGRSVAVDGDTAVVGAPDADVGDNADQGAAYIFYRNQGGPDAWGQVAKLTAALGEELDSFGISVAIDGDTVIVGADSADGVNVDQGAAYVFYRDEGGAGAWGVVAKLTAADGAAGDKFGYSVSVSSYTAVVGAPTNIGPTAYVFYRHQGGFHNWGQAAVLTPDQNPSYFGVSVSVSGDTAVVGAEATEVGGNGAQGAAYIFDRNQGGSGAWGQVTRLTAADGAAEDRFGRSVSTNGDTVVVGAYKADGANVDQGAAYLFYQDQGGAGAWGQVTKLTAAGGLAEDYFGSSVLVNGHMVVVGAYFADVGDHVDQGAAYFFYRDHSGAWGQVACLTAADGVGYDYFGSSVAASGGTVVVGAPNGDLAPADNHGAAYVYHLLYRLYLPLVAK